MKATLYLNEYHTETLGNTLEMGISIPSRPEVAASTSVVDANGLPSRAQTFVLNRSTLHSYHLKGLEGPRIIPQMITVVEL